MSRSFRSCEPHFTLDKGKSDVSLFPIIAFQTCPHFAVRGAAKIAPSQRAAHGLGVSSLASWIRGLLHDRVGVIVSGSS